MRVLLVFTIFIHILCFGQQGNPYNVSNQKLYKQQVELKKIINEKNLSGEEAISYKIRLAEISLERGKIFSAILILNDILNNAKEEEVIDLFFFAQIHLCLANAYDRLLDIENFLSHTKKFYHYYKLAEPEKQIYKSLFYSYMSRYYNIRMLYVKATMYSEKSLKIFHENKVDARLISEELIYSNHLFSLRNSQESFEIKKSYRDTILRLINKKYPGYHRQKSELTISANMFLIDTLKRSYVSKSFQEESNKLFSNQLIKILTNEIETVDRNIGYYNVYSARYETLLGLVYLYNNRLEESLSCYEKTINKITASDTIDNNLFSPYNFMLSSAYLLKGKTLQLLYESTHNTSYLFYGEKELNKLKVAWQLYIQDRVVNKNDFNTNCYLTNPYSIIQNNYIQLHKVTQNDIYQDKIFEAGELSKHFSTQYLAKLKNQKDDFLHTYDTSIKKYCTFENFLDEISKDKTVLASSGIEVSIPELSDSFIKQPFSLEDLKKNMKENQVYLSYTEQHTLDDKISLIAHLITKKKDTIFYLKDFINDFVDENPDTINEALKKNDVNLFQKESNFFYEVLLADVVNYLEDEIEEIIIAQSPNIERLNINFNALVTDIIPSKTFKNLKYIGKKYAFSYAISAATMFNEDTNDDTAKEITIFVSNPKELTKLLYKDRFLTNISSNFNVKIISDEHSNKANFITHLKEDKIIIVIGHGVGNDTDEIYKNGIYFNDGFLSIEEFETIKSKCDLLVLAGCSTGVGFGSRDGVINFARTMTISGVKSILLSTRDIDEASTLNLLNSWFSHLVRGESKSKALQIAQNEFLEKVSSRTTNPSYWAHLNLVGNTDGLSIKQTDGISNYLVLFLILILVLIIWNVRK